MRFLKNKLFLFLEILGLILLPGFSLADAQIITTYQGVIDVLNKIAQWVFWFFIVAAVIYIIVIAFNILTASGDPDKLSKANTQLIYAVIAIAIATLALAIVHFVAGIFGATFS